MLFRLKFICFHLRHRMFLIFILKTDDITFSNLKKFLCLKSVVYNIVFANRKTINALTLINSLHLIFSITGAVLRQQPPCSAFGVYPFFLSPLHYNPVTSILKILCIFFILSVMVSVFVLPCSQID